MFDEKRNVPQSAAAASAAQGPVPSDVAATAELARIQKQIWQSDWQLSANSGVKIIDVQTKQVKTVPAFVAKQWEMMQTGAAMGERPELLLNRVIRAGQEAYYTPSTMRHAATSKYYQSFVEKDYATKNLREFPVATLSHREQAQEYISKSSLLMAELAYKNRLGAMGLPLPEVTDPKRADAFIENLFVGKKLLQTSLETIQAACQTYKKSPLLNETFQCILSMKTITKDNIKELQRYIIGFKESLALLGVAPSKRHKIGDALDTYFILCKAEAGKGVDDFSKIGMNILRMAAIDTLDVFGGGLLAKAGVSAAQAGATIHAVEGVDTSITAQKFMSSGQKSPTSKDINLNHEQELLKQRKEIIGNDPDLLIKKQFNSLLTAVANNKLSIADATACAAIIVFFPHLAPVAIPVMKAAKHLLLAVYSVGVKVQTDKEVADHIAKYDKFFAACKDQLNNQPVDQVAVKKLHRPLPVTPKAQAEAHQLAKAQIQEQPQAHTPPSAGTSSAAERAMREPNAIRTRWMR